MVCFAGMQKRMGVRPSVQFSCLIVSNAEDSVKEIIPELPKPLHKAGLNFTGRPSPFPVAFYANWKETIRGLITLLHAALCSRSSALLDYGRGGIGYVQPARVKAHAASRVEGLSTPRSPKGKSHASSGPGPRLFRHRLSRHGVFRLYRRIIFRMDCLGRVLEFGNIKSQ